jgi:glycosyltransferase involved in cell wall biosynthesis
MPLPLSIALISYNEEKNLRRCLSSVADLAREIVLVDSGSTDATLTIASEFGAKIAHQEWLGYQDQKNHALDFCTQKWVLALDCDEELSSELKKSLIQFFEHGDCDRFHGATFHRCTWFLGRWIRHGDWYPDTKLRLFRRGDGVWVEPIHETVSLFGPTTHLKGDLLHYSFPSMESYIKKIHPFAEEFFQKQKKKKWSLGSTILRPLWRFFRTYVLRRGFLDGFPGLWIAVATGFSVFVRYSRSYEAESDRK